MSMTPDAITALFTRPRDGFRFARWGRPVAPVIFGVDDASLGILRDATKAVFGHAGHPIAETDPEMGANFLTFFGQSWGELAEIPDLEELTGSPGLAQRLRTVKGDNYRLFRFEKDGAIRACVSLVNMGGALGRLHAGVLAETLAVRATLSFAQEVGASRDLAALIRAAYSPELPAAATDPAFAYRLAARLPASSV